jgi:hypothetical protein
MNCFENGFTIKKTQLAERFDYSAFQERHGDQNIPLFLIKRNGGLAIFTSDNDVFPQPGDSLISLAKAA